MPDCEPLSISQIQFSLLCFHHMCIKVKNVSPLSAYELYDNHILTWSITDDMIFGFPHFVKNNKNKNL